MVVPMEMKEPEDVVVLLSFKRKMHDIDVVLSSMVVFCLLLLFSKKERERETRLFSEPEICRLLE